MSVRIFVPDVKEAIKERDFKGLKVFLTQLWPQDIVEILEELQPNEMTLVFRLLPKDLAAHVFSELAPEEAQKILEGFSNDEIRTLLTKLDPDDRTALFDELPASVVRRLLAILSPEERQKALLLFNYPEDSCGHTMSTKFVEVKDDVKVEDALNIVKREIRRLPKEVLYEIFVIGKGRELKGSVSILDLIGADPSTQVRTLVSKSPISVKVTDDREKAGRLLKKYDLVSIPVVDSENRLLGVITVDDVIDILEEEATEDLYKFVAVTKPEEKYFELPLRERVLKRLPWLIFLVFVQNISGRIIASFGNLMSQVVALSFFIPMLMDTGGNVGSQSTSFVIRALATGEIGTRQFLRSFLKEVMTILLISTVLGVLAFLTGFLIINQIRVPLILGFSMLIVVFAANMMGFLLPFVAKILRQDPAAISAPLITTIVDFTALIIYFNLARFLLAKQG